MQLLLIFAVAILANIASNRAFFRIDLTEEKVYSLSPVSKDIVQTLAEPLTVRAFFTQNLPAPYNNVEPKLRDLLDEYAIENRDFFDYTFHTISSDESVSEARRSKFEDLAYQHRIFPVQIRVVEQDEVKAISAYMGVAFSHGDAIETIQAVTSTERMEYRITQAIRSLNARISALVNLEENIYTVLFLSSKMFAYSDELASIPTVAERVVSNINSESHNRLRFAYLDPDTQPQASEWIDAYRVSPLQYITQSDDSESLSRMYATLLMTMSDKAYRLDILQPVAGTYRVVSEEAIEEFVSASLQSFVEYHTEVGYLVDYDTPPYRGSSSTIANPQVEVDLASFYPLLTSVYTIRPVFLEQGEKIPEELSSLIVVGPRERFDDHALYQIDQFLMKGKSVLMFLDTYDIELPMSGADLIPGGRPYYTPRDTGLEQLIAHYGLTLQRSYVLDEFCYTESRQLPDGTVTDEPIYFAPLIQDWNIGKDHEFMTGIGDLIMLSISPLGFDPEAQTGVEAHLLYTSSSRSWEHGENPTLFSPVYATPPDDSMKAKHPLAYVLEGTFTSYYADKPLPSFENVEIQVGAESREGITLDSTSIARAFIDSGTGGKLFVVGTSAILGDGLLDRDGLTSNSLFFLNLLDYMNENEERAVLRGKGRGSHPLEQDNRNLRFFAKIFNIAGLPVLIAFAGMIAWATWFARRRRVSRAFATESDSKGNW